MQKNYKAGTIIKISNEKETNESFVDNTKNPEKSLIPSRSGLNKSEAETIYISSRLKQGRSAYQVTED